jgi:2-polyprenyl-3-methyl-5-hydroxy-6-metoxy-1,4-benzoquinol methylase
MTVMGDRERWDRRHAEKPGAEEPSDFLTEVFYSNHWNAPRGKALDLATGAGRNAIFVADQGFEVLGIDISPVALAEAQRRAAARSLSITWQQADLEAVELPANCYDLVLNFNYLQRSLVPQIKAALKPGGWVIFETYLTEQQTLGHPKNPDYLLSPNELLGLFRDFRVLYYREGRFAHRGESAFLAGILAQKED